MKHDGEILIEKLQAGCRIRSTARDPINHCLHVVIDDPAKQERTHLRLSLIWLQEAPAEKFAALEAALTQCINKPEQPGEPLT